MRRIDLSQLGLGQTARATKQDRFGLRASSYRPEPHVRIGASGDFGVTREFAAEGAVNLFQLKHRLLSLDPDQLSDLEMIELLLSVGDKFRDTKPMARVLLRRFGTFAAILSATTDELIEACGQGGGLVSTIKFVHASGIRLAKTVLKSGPILGKFDNLIEYLNTVLGHETVEVTHVVYLDNRNRVIECESLGRGTVDQTPVYPREIMKRAIHVGATAFVIAHNHLAGDPKPSAADIYISEKIRVAADSLGITFHDHIIIGKGSWLSFRKEGFFDI